MKIRISYLFIMIFVCFIAFPVYAEDIQKEFQGIKWGADLKSLSGFKLLYTKDNVLYYMNPKKIYEINEKILTNVIYGSYEGAFFAVYMNIDNAETFAEIKSYMKTKYGLPKRTFSAKNDETVESWTEKDIKIKLKHKEMSGEMKLAFYYTPISQNVDEEEQEEELSERGIRILPREKRETYDSHPLLVF